MSKGPTEVKKYIAKLRAENLSLARRISIFTAREEKSLRGSQNKLERLLTYREVSALTGIPVGTLKYWVHIGKVPHVRTGPRMVRFSADVLALWLKNSAIDPAPSATIQ